MQYRKLGRTGLKVSGLCLGSDNFENSFGAMQETSFRIMGRALDFGVNFIDTADQYANVNSETIIGARREDHIKGIIDVWSAGMSADVVAEVRRITNDFATKTPHNYPPPFPFPSLGGSGAV